MKEESMIMKVLASLGFYSMAWSARRLFCPVDSEALVLEVGSGGNPYFRSNVLLDAYEDTRERHWAPLITDRPTVLGFVEHLPFRDGAFDFVIASHVLEHSADPSRFLGELQRVSKAGYIEVPDAFMERINPYRDHRLEITKRENRLQIRKKKDWKHDSELVDLYEYKLKPIITSETMKKHPFEFHIRHYWNGQIDFDLIDPEVDANWVTPSSSQQKSEVRVGLRQRIGEKILRFARKRFSQTRRNAELSLFDLLACPCCLSSELKTNKDSIVCVKCDKSFHIRNGIPVMYPE